MTRNQMLRRERGLPALEYDDILMEFPIEQIIETKRQNKLISKILIFFNLQDYDYCLGPFKSTRAVELFIDELSYDDFLTQIALNKRCPLYMTDK